MILNWSCPQLIFVLRIYVFSKIYSSKSYLVEKEVSVVVSTFELI